MPPAKKSKVVEAPEEVVVPAHIKENERMITITITGKFERGTALVQDDYAEFEGGAGRVASGIPSPVKGGAHSRRVGTPTLGKQPKGRTSTPNRGLKDAPPQAESVSVYPSFPFTVNKPFFSLHVPGIEVIGDTPNTTVEQQDAVPKSFVAPVDGLPQHSNPVRVLPSSNTVNEQDGTFKIEMYRKNLTICPLSVDAMLAHPFRLGVHAVPEISAAQRLLIASVDEAQGAGGKGVAGKGQGSKKNPNATPQMSEQDLKAAQDAIAASSPSTIPIIEAHTLLAHDFDLSHVFRDACFDRIDLVDEEDVDGSQPITDDSTTALLDTRPPVGAHTLGKTQMRRARLHCTRSIPGLMNLSISIVCSEPLLSPANLARYLPMTVDVCEVDGLPSLKRDTVDLRHTMNPRIDEIHLTTIHHKQTSVYGGYDVDAYSRLGGAKFSPVTVKYNLIGGKSDEVSTPEAPHARSITFNHRKIVFLYKYSTVEMYEFFFFKGIDLRLHDRDTVTPHDQSLLLGSTTNPNRAPKEKALGYGIAEVPLRAAVDGETRFTINHQIVPRRDMGEGAAYGADYISNSTTIKAKVTLLHPLPRCTYTVPKSLVTPFPSTGSILGEKKHLSRALFVMPYRSDNTQLLLQALMGTLISFVKASGPTAAVVALPPADANNAQFKAPADERGGAVNSPPSSRTGSARGNTPQSKGKPLKDSAKGGGKGGKRGGAKGEGSSEGTAASAQDEIMRGMLEHLPPIQTTAAFLVPEGISGFEVMDGEQRIVCLEGYVHMVHLLVTKVASVLGEAADKDPSIRVLVNTDLQFPQRWYHEWPPLVKPMPELFQAYGTKKAQEVHQEVAPESNTPQATPRPPPGKKEKVKGAKAPKKSAPQKNLQEQEEKEAQALAAVALAKEAEIEVDRKRHQSNRNELDAGGVGGRIRRIKLNQTISTLVRQQRNFLKRCLSTDTLRCVQKLAALRTVSSMINAVDHDFFPTPEELVSLERVGGDTLGIFDICGSDRYYSFGEGMAEQAVEEANIQQIETIHRRTLKRPLSTAEVLEQGITANHIGRVLNFIATPSTVDQRVKSKATKLSNDVFPRYKQKTYMVLDRDSTSQHTGEISEDPAPENAPLLLCCFSNPPPTQLLRYLVNAQVVGAFRRAGDVEMTPVLFVLRFETVAKNCSDNRNPEYEEHLKKESRRAHPREYNRIMAQKRAHYEATHSDGATRRPCRADDSDEEDQEGFIDPPPYIPEDDAPTQGEDDGGIESVLVRNDYVTLNRNVPQTLERWNKPIATKDNEDTDHDRLWDLYETQTKKLELIDSKVSQCRVSHTVPFRSGAQKTAAEARRLPQAYDALSSGDDEGEASPPRDDSYSGPVQPPMKFHGAGNLLVQTSVVNDRSGTMTAAAEHNENLRRKEADDKEWKSKVVVDNLHFAVHNRSVEKPVHSLSSLRGMLVDEPMKKSIKDTFTAPPPVSIRESEKIALNPRVETKQVKHPEQQGFYYAGPALRNPTKPPPISDTEKSKSQALWSRQA
jgi:hypothetical protein